jgi:pectin methylesterase-like acyl-CoA thioesterase
MGGSAGSGATDPTLPAGLTSRFPRGDQTGVCNDVALRLDFTNAVTLGSSGRIQIFSMSGGAAVDSIDMATMRITDTIGGKTYNLLRPVFVDGRQAVAYFHQHRLQPNTQYYVTVDASVFSASGFAGVTSTTAWRFTTGPAPTSGSSLSVQAKGGGTHCMVQGALDTIPASNTSAVTVTIGAGIYHEIVYMTGKRNVTLRGADRAGTVITYANNDMLNAGTSGRPMMFITGSNGFVMENLTLHNTTPQGGSQAEALRSNSDQTILRRVNLRSLQDTLLSNERLYVSNSLIEGNVDYIWGGGPTYFDTCEIKTVGRAGYLVQSRNGTGYGYVFVDSRLTSDSGITGDILARIDASTYPSSHVAFINCEMGPHIAAAGWTVTGTASSSLRFWEYQSKTPSGAAVNTSSRSSASRQISASEAATMRDKTVILGGWNPAP